ncbi:hypothetical protein KCU88_g6162, partial [Aureobasidium melanogenum]
MPNQIPPLHLIQGLRIRLFDIPDRNLDPLSHEHLRNHPAEPGPATRDHSDLGLPVDFAMRPMRDAMVDPDRALYHGQRRRVVQRIVGQWLAVFVH